MEEPTGPRRALTARLAWWDNRSRAHGRDDVLRSLCSEQINLQYPGSEIAAIEVYTRKSHVPMEYQTALPEGGVVALWTRPPAMRFKK